MTTYDFYRDVYGGSLDETVFSEHVTEAEAIISALLYPTVIGDISSTEIFHRAVCSQVEYGVKLGEAGSRLIKSESLGDRSVTYGESDGGIRIRGVAVSPVSVMILEGAGYLNRWI